MDPHGQPQDSANGRRTPKRFGALDDVLDDNEDAIPPAEWIISQICEEFGCLPSAALPEDLGLIADIMELRRYARAKARVDAAKSADDYAKLPKWDQEWVMKVQEFNIKRWRAQQS